MHALSTVSAGGNAPGADNATCQVGSPSQTARFGRRGIGRRGIGRRGIGRMGKTFQPWVRLRAVPCGILLFTIGVGLLGLLLVGKWLLPNAKDLQKLAQKQPFRLSDAVNQVHAATVHADDRRITVSESWVQYLAGLFYRPLLRTQRTERLLAGRVGNCSERAQILKSICESAGYQTRFCGLNGHVVLEVKKDGEWYTLDPDYGVTFPMPMRSLAHHENTAVVRRQLARSGHDSATIDEYLRILHSTNDNVVLGMGVPLSPRLYRIEQICDWLSWIIPLGLMALGCTLLGHRRPRGLPRHVQLQGLSEIAFRSAPA